MESTTKTGLKEDNESYLGDSVVITKPGKIEKLPFKYNGLREDEVLVKMKGCSLHDDDIICWEGSDSINYPMAMGMPGKDGWGVVEKAGELTNLKKGDPVALLSDKCLSNYVICNHMELTKLPFHFRELMFPAESFAYAHYLFRKANVKKGQVVVILGKGFYSKVFRQLAKKEGATVITVGYNNKLMDPYDKTYNIIGSNGHMFNGEEEDNDSYNWYDGDHVIQKVIQYTNGRGCDCVIELTGSQPSIDFACKILHKDGILVLAKKASIPISIGKNNDCNLQLICANDLNLNDRLLNINNAIKAIKHDLIDPHDFVTHAVSFNEVEKAFEIICNNPKDYLKCIVTF